MLELEYQFKCEKTTEIINNLAQELNNVKGHIGQLTMMSRPPTPFPFNNVNKDFKFSHEKIAQNDEPEQESMEYDEDESEEYSEDDERIIVSDEDDDDDISVEELSDDEEENNSQSVEIEDIEIETSEKHEEPEQSKQSEEKIKEPLNFSKMNLGSLKAYIVEKGLVEDASKMKKAQILTLIQEQQPVI